MRLRYIAPAALDTAVKTFYTTKVRLRSLWSTRLWNHHHLSIPPRCDWDREGGANPAKVQNSFYTTKVRLRSVTGGQGTAEAKFTFYTTKVRLRFQRSAGVASEGQPFYTTKVRLRLTPDPATDQPVRTFYTTKVRLRWSITFIIDWNKPYFLYHQGAIEIILKEMGIVPEDNLSIPPRCDWDRRK